MTDLKVTFFYQVFNFYLFLLISSDCLKLLKFNFTEYIANVLITVRMFLATDNTQAGLNNNEFFNEVYWLHSCCYRMAVHST